MRESFAFVGNETVGSMVEERLVALGYVRAKDAGDAGTVVTYCTSQTALEDVYFDEDGLVQIAAKGTLLVDLSPSTPSFARELGAVATVSDLVAVEAPLAVVDPVRADAFADKENLVCFAAGDEDALAAARPVLEAVAGTVRDMGGAGAGQLARAAWTLQTMAQIVSAIEADALYRAVRRSAPSFGQDILRVGSVSPLAESVLAAVGEGRFGGDYTVEMFMAELSAALTAADDADLILPQAEACLHLLELLAVIGGSDKAPSALALVYGEESACAEQGLDWTRAEAAFGEGGEGYESDGDGFGDDGDAGGCGHSHGGYRDYPDYPGYGAYSAN
ncbi:6-phosphogluconate dehydrogenase [Gordonibacter sp. An230]|uniref:NAD(P)-binding domain-containing protein n=1 Tax=Gordonibacter sp. An230 TaxID=1965592 RepID=UPI000B3A44FC|nr:NAD(P)-binding domain-containing protein [Gordonibacter sp. An230]OUO88027.1 6-phosphogluconate dehydrogenase [Gordonibacter sp. An230]